MDDLIKRQGLGFFLHVLWRLHDHIIRAYEEWVPEIGYLAPPRTHSTLLAIHEAGSLSVTELAATVRSSHPLVITWVRQLREAGLVKTSSDPADGRKTIVSLTARGKREFARHVEARKLIARAFERLMDEADAHVFDALWRLEGELQREPFIERLRVEQNRSNAHALPGTD